MNIVLTGGTSGLGKSLITDLSANSENIIIATGASAAKIERLNSKSLQNVYMKKRDFNRSEDIKLLIEDIEHIFCGEVDILINNAGIAYHGNITGVVEAQLREVFNVNVIASILLTSRIIRYMKNGSKIINISSFLGSRGTENTAVYTASKHALNGFSKVLRNEMAKQGISVTVIEPGALATNFNTRTTDPEMEKNFQKRTTYSIPVGIITEYIKLVIATDPKVCPEVIRIMPTEVSSE